MWTTNRLTRLLGIDYPIFQGPFGGGNSTIALAREVSNAGGLGAIGAVQQSPDEIKQTIKNLYQQTSKPFSINLWVPIDGQDNAKVTDSQFEQAVGILKPYFAELGLPVPKKPEQFAHKFEDQVQALLEAKPPVFSFVMGIPDESILKEAKRLGIVTVGTATTVAEAIAIEKAGADVVVASGSDAGGHRGSFLQPVESSLVGTMSLTPQIASAVKIPVVAAGGIADGRGIAAALALGAHGVQIGTAFLATHESGAPAVHKQVLGQPVSRWTRLTRVFSGRFSRGIENTMMMNLQQSIESVLPYPAQNWLTMPIRRAAGASGNRNAVALWAGSNAASARSMSAAELVKVLVGETNHVLAQDHLKPSL